MKLYNNFCQVLKDNKIDKITEYRHIGGRNNKDYYLKYMNNNERKVLFLFDGYDENEINIIDSDKIFDVKIEKI